MSEAEAAAAAARLLEFMRSGGRVLEAHGATEYEARLSEQLGKFMKFCYNAIGNLSLVSGSRCAPSLAGAAPCRRRMQLLFFNFAPSIACRHCKVFLDSRPIAGVRK